MTQTHANSTRIRFLAKAGIIAALYVALTMLSALFGLASGAVQVRISEALCILPVFSAAAIPGLTVGCLLSNLLCGGTIYDIIVGTLASLIGALLAWCLRRLPYLAFLPTVLANTLLVPFVLILSGIGGWNMYPYFALTVGLGEVIACGLLGTLLLLYIKKHRAVAAMLSA